MAAGACTRERSRSPSGVNTDRFEKIIELKGEEELFNIYCEAKSDEESEALPAEAKGKTVEHYNDNWVELQQKLTEVNQEVTTLKRKQDFQREVAKDIAQEVFANQVRIEPSKCRFHMTVIWKSMLDPKTRIATTQAAIGRAHQDGKLRIIGP